MFSKLASRLVPACLAVALTSGVSAAGASEYDFVSVGTGTGLNNFSTGIGGNFGEITSIDLSGGFTSRSASYSITNFNTFSGNWSLQSASGSLFGTFSTTSDQFYSPVFQRFVSTSTITGGTGTFLNATGSGTSEMVLYSTCCSPNGLSSPYHSVVVDRLHVILPGSVVLDQGDTSGATVLIKLGSENVQTGVGYNEGPLVSSGPSAFPPITSERSDYTFDVNNGPPYIGTFLDTGATPGDTFSGHAVTDKLTQSFWGFAYGTGLGTFDSGTGAYEGISGQTRYEVFSVGLGSQDGGINFDYGAVSIARSVNAVPEPETIALMVVGLGFVAFHIRRKISARAV